MTISDFNKNWYRMVVFGPGKKSQICKIFGEIQSKLRVGEL